MEILLVDDEIDLLDQAKLFLEREEERIKVVTATSAKEALDKIENNDFSGIVSDYKMPGMDGLEFLKFLREKRNINIPFIIFTGKGREEVAVEAINLGADRYLQKGGDPKSQYDILANAIIQEVEKWRSRKRIQMIYQNTPDLIAQINKQGEFVDANKAIAKSLGIAPDDLIGKNLKDIISEDVAERRLKIGGRVIEENKVEIFEDEREGKIFQNVFVPVSIPGERDSFQVIARNITEKRKGGKENKSEKYLLQSLFNDLPNSIYFKDRDAQYVKVSKAKADWLGLAPEEIVGKTDFDFYPEEQAGRIHNEDMKVIEEEQSTINKEKKLEKPSGEEKWVSVTKVPWHDNEGEVIGLLGTSRDISERKKREEREEFLYALLRHDLKNKSQIAQGYLELLREMDLPEEAGRYIQKTSKSVLEGTELIEKVRTLRSVEEIEEYGSVSLRSTIQSVISGYEDQAKKKNIKIEVGEVQAKVRGDSLLEELFDNLVQNSIRHSECSKIEISGKKLDGKYRITVEDDGKGIPDEVKDKIFDRDFKKGRTAGSGLGLKIVERIAEKFGGSVKVKDSELGGARFDVYLPTA